MDFIENFLMFLIIAIMIIFGPHVTIWAVNLLFGLSIPHNWYTWFAVLWLGYTWGRK